MPPLYPAHGVVPVKSGARKYGVSECAETEITRNTKGFDGLVWRLINVLHAEVGHVWRVCRRMAAGRLAGHAEPEVIQGGGAEYVSLLDSCIERVIGRLV